ncbi:premnaspirodiene oxygenase-like [Triticum dicoccoides]|uniref:premnaspirodiene oxygenase-like n=1 Tax=Triticum dicoccoides TaxID=85692 RepID=UPI00162E42F6|nr:premnaspirodiene oxygenase-like [Triticum dicoccoides]
MEYYYYHILLAFVPLVVYYYYLMKSWFRGHRLPPGPWQLPVIGSLHHLRGDVPHRRMRDLSRRHGPVMFLKLGGIPVVVASSCEAAEDVLSTNDAVLASRPQTPTVKVLTRQGHDIVLAKQGEHWRQLRKICVHELLSASRVRSFRPIREQEAMRLVQAVAASSAGANLDELLAAHVNNVTVRAVMGDGEVDDRETLLRLTAKAIELVGSFHLADMFPSSWIARALSSRAMHRVELYVEELFTFMDVIISQHLERRRSSAHVEEEDLIDVLLRIREESRLGFPISMATIKGVLFDVLAAGSETPASVLLWAMAELMRNPAIMSRAQSEVREAFMEQRKVTEDGLGKLSYLQSVIKETLRMHTPGPLALPRESQEACRIMGYDVPKGTMVLVNAWAISRDPEQWDEPEVFKPDRFVTDRRDFRGRDYEFTPFGAGRRICPGMLFSAASMYLALAHLLFYFDWDLMEDTTAAELDMTETMGMTARRKAQLWLKPTLHASFDFKMN